MTNQTLINQITAVVKANGAQGITGTNLQGVLVDMVTELGRYPGFAGIADPSTNPGTPDGNVFYLATAPGVYSHFGGYTLSPGEVAIFKNTSGSWQTVTTDIASITKIGVKPSSLYWGFDELNKYYYFGYTSIAGDTQGWEPMNVNEGDVFLVLEPGEYVMIPQLDVVSPLIVGDFVKCIQAGEVDSDGYVTYPRFEPVPVASILQKDINNGLGLSPITAWGKNTSDNKFYFGWNQAEQAWGGENVSLNEIFLVRNSGDYVLDPQNSTAVSLGEGDFIRCTQAGSVNAGGYTTYPIFERVQLDAISEILRLREGVDENSAKITELLPDVIFDISEYNKVDNVLKTYTDLSDALTDIPVDRQYGGMTVRYVQTSDNKYVQYRLMTTSFSITEADWHGGDFQRKEVEDCAAAIGLTPRLVENLIFYAETSTENFNNDDNILSKYLFYRSGKINSVDWGTGKYAYFLLPMPYFIEQNTDLHWNRDISYDNLKDFDFEHTLVSFYPEEPNYIEKIAIFKDSITFSEEEWDLLHDKFNLPIFRNNKFNENGEWKSNRGFCKKPFVNLIKSPMFENTADWTIDTEVWHMHDNMAECNDPNGAQSSIKQIVNSLEVGKKYRLCFKILNYTSGSVQVRVDWDVYEGELIMGNIYMQVEFIYTKVGYHPRTISFRPGPDGFVGAIDIVELVEL